MSPIGSPLSLARVGSVLFLSLLWASVAYGQVTIDMTKLNCEQLYFSKLDSKTMAIWFSGFYQGKRNDAVVDVQKVKDNTEKLRKFCFQNANSKVPVMDAIERVVGPKP